MSKGVHSTYLTDTVEWRLFLFSVKTEPVKLSGKTGRADEAPCGACCCRKRFRLIKKERNMLRKEGQVRIPSGCAIAAVISKNGTRMSGELITNEVVPRVVGAALALVGSLLALVAGFLGLGSKFKGSGVSSILSAVLGAGGLAALLIAGSHYSEQAGASAVKLVLAAAGVLAVAALANGIASLSASKKANV